MNPTRRDRGSAGAVVVTAVAAVTVALLMAGALVLTTKSWANASAEDERLLPGTTLAGVDVGGMRASDAEQAVEEAVASRLDQPHTVSHDGQRWEVSPRELGTTADVAGAVRRALTRGSEASLPQLVAIRWFGGDVDVDVPVELDRAKIAAFADHVAEEVDRQPRDATAEWSGQDVALVDHRPGRRVERGTFIQNLSQALLGPGEAVDLPVEELPVQLTSKEVEPLLPKIRDRVAAAFGQRLSVVAEGEGVERRWQATPEQLGAVPDVQEMLGSLQAADESGAGAEPAPLTVPDDELTAYVEGLADEVYEAPRSAELNWTGEGIEVTEDEPGRRLETDQAAQALEAAVRNRSDSVDLPIVPAEAETTAEDYRHVLVLRQQERRLYHYVDGQESASWPVAVGAGGSPTPTGHFTVGTKRYEPTWHNPDPNGWGADMPATVGPGPQNPLGVRALNWNSNGVDTLIRFHGTAATNSIGTAASKGCVRLSNDDVVTLYDRVPSGTAILSVD